MSSPVSPHGSHTSKAYDSDSSDYTSSSTSSSPRQPRSRHTTPPLTPLQPERSTHSPFTPICTSSSPQVFSITSLSSGSTSSTTASVTSTASTVSKTGLLIFSGRSASSFSAQDVRGSIFPPHPKAVKPKKPTRPLNYSARFPQTTRSLPRPTFTPASYPTTPSVPADSSQPAAYSLRATVAPSSYPATPSVPAGSSQPAAYSLRAAVAPSSYPATPSVPASSFQLATYSSSSACPERTNQQAASCLAVASTTGQQPILRTPPTTLLSEAMVSQQIDIINNSNLAPEEKRLCSLALANSLIEYLCALNQHFSSIADHISGVLQSHSVHYPPSIQ